MDKLEKTDSAAMVVLSPAQLIQTAIQSDADIEKLQKLMDMQERWEANQARKSFYQAMADFQSQVPTILKTKEVSFNNTKYNYASLDSITEQIRDLLKDCGLSYRWETKDENQMITITCVITHIDGHSETNQMCAPKDSSGGKNNIQSIGSTTTYLKRYTLIGALGISTGEEDNDGRTSEAKGDIIGDVLRDSVTKHVAKWETKDEFKNGWPVLKASLESEENGKAIAAAIYNQIIKPAHLKAKS